jgi:hypothetical protein
MKARTLAVLTILALIVAILPVSVHAQAYTTSFITSVTYQNVGDGPADIVVEFYASPDTTTPITITRPQLAQGASTSLFVGSLSEITPPFRGSAVIRSNQPLLATMVQLPQGSTIVRNRPLSNGFAAGAPVALIATVLKNQFDTTSIFSVQNAGDAPTTATFKFYNTSATLVHQFDQVIQPGAAYYVDAGQVAELGPSFNGSAVVESTGSIVAGVMELSTTGANASAFEGVGQGATKVYMPSALCNAFGGTNTAYAVQNTSLTEQTQVTVTYSNGVQDTKTIGPGAKASFLACNAPGMPSGFSGSATVESTVTPIIAIGKASGLGLSTAFVGASAGASQIALPYVRWANDANYAAGVQQRVFLTIQNIGDTDLPAGSVTVQYIDKFGAVQGTPHVLGAIPAGGKVNSNASNAGLTEFGVYPDGSFGGGALVTGPAGSQLAVVARVSTQVAPGQFASEDYSGMPTP